MRTIQSLVLGAEQIMETFYKKHPEVKKTQTLKTTKMKQQQISCTTK
jgi:hypothetical protein